MTIVRIHKRGNISRTASEVEVTLAQVGSRGWHVHSRYMHVCQPTVVGLCGDAPDERAAEDLFEHACELADAWHAKEK